MQANLVRVQLVKEKRVEYRPVTSTADAAALAEKVGLMDSAEERVYLFCLSTKGHITDISEVSHGSLSESSVHPREVLKRAALSNAYGYILAHNHPSGDATPSEEDKSVTVRLLQAGEILGIPLLDHIIVAQGEPYYSFKASGLFDKLEQKAKESIRRLM